VQQGNGCCTPNPIGFSGYASAAGGPAAPSHRRRPVFIFSDSGRTAAKQQQNSSSRRGRKRLTFPLTYLVRYESIDQEEMQMTQTQATPAQMKSTKIWNSGLEYILSAAFEAGIGIENIELRLSASGVTGEGEAHRLMANLAKCGAKVTQNGDVLTVSLRNEHASECLRRDSEK